MSQSVYQAPELYKRIVPVIEKYGIRQVYLFGSYARNEATEHSDVDLLITRHGSRIKSLLDMGAFCEDLEHSLEKRVDVVTMESLAFPINSQHNPLFAEQLYKDRVMLYEKQ